MTTSNLESPIYQAYTSAPNPSLTECGSIGAPFFMNDLDTPRPSFTLNSPNLYSSAVSDALETTASLELSHSAQAAVPNNIKAEPEAQHEATPSTASTSLESCITDSHAEAAYEVNDAAAEATSVVDAVATDEPCVADIDAKATSTVEAQKDDAEHALADSSELAVAVSNDVVGTTADSTVAGDEALCLDKAECVGDVADASNLVVKVFNKDALSKAEAAGFTVEEVAAAYTEDERTLAETEADARANANAMSSQCVVNAIKRTSGRNADFIMPSGVNMKLLKAVAPKLDWHKLKTNLNRNMSSKEVIDSMYVDECDEHTDESIKMIELWERGLDTPLSKTIKGAAAMVQRVFERLNYIKNAAIRNIIFNNINIPKDLSLFKDFNCNVIGYDNSDEPYIDSDQAITNFHANGNCNSKLCVLSLSDDDELNPTDSDTAATTSAADAAADAAATTATADAAAADDSCANADCTGADSKANEKETGSGAADNGKKCGSKVNNFTMYMDLAKGAITTAETDSKESDSNKSSLVSLVAPARNVMQRTQLNKLKQAISGLRALAIANSLDEEASPSDAISLYAKDSVLHPLMQALSEQNYCDEALDNGKYFHESGKTAYLHHHFDNYAFFKKNEVSAITERAKSITNEYQSATRSKDGNVDCDASGCIGARERYNKAMMQIFSDAGYRFMPQELIADLFNTLMAFDAAQRRLHRYVPFEQITNASVATLPLDHVVVLKIRQLMRILGLYRLIFDYSQDNEWSSILQDSFDIFKDYAARQLLTDVNCRELLETLRINQSEHDLKRAKNVRRFFISPELLDNDATMLYDHRIHHFIPSRVNKVQNFLAIVAYINERARFSNKAHVATMPLLQMLEHPENTTAASA